MWSAFFSKKFMKESIEYQAGAALVDDGMEFDIPFYFNKKIRLNIKPLKPGTNVRISQKITKLKEVDAKNPTINEFLEKGGNTKIIAGIIATAVINRDIFKMWKYRWLKWLLLNCTQDMEYLYQYFLIVQRQSGPLFFYRIMGLTPAMNFLMKQEKTEAKPGEEKPSGERWP